MHKFPISDYRTFSELPFDKFDTFRFSVYILDFDWNYLFVNRIVSEYLGTRGRDLVGKNMWDTFPELVSDPMFFQLREKMDRKVPHGFETVSPVTGQRLHVTGYPLEDCLYFTSSVLPDKQDLLNDLRSQLPKGRPTHNG